MRATARKLAQARAFLLLLWLFSKKRIFEDSAKAARFFKIKNKIKVIGLKILERIVLTQFPSIFIALSEI